MSYTSEYKIDIQKSVAFLYTNKEISEKEVKKTIQFKISPKIPRNKFNHRDKRPALGKL